MEDDRKMEDWKDGRMMTLLRKIYYFLPPSWRFLVRRVYYWPVDLIERYFRTDRTLIPPKGLIYTGSGDFRQQGERMLRHFIELGQLQPENAVLDIGSGIGRLALPLSQYLSEEGKYEGFDVVKKGVDWCKKNISKTHSNFHFTHVPLMNDLYRSDGAAAEDYVFPYEKSVFDFAFAISVFTHMLPEEVDNYLKEANRVLKKGGRLFATFFIWDEDRSSGKYQNPAFYFKFKKLHYLLMDEKVKSANVAFKESFLMELLHKNNFEIENSYKGFWDGRPKEACKDFQDILILKSKLAD